MKWSKIAKFNLNGLLLLTEPRRALQPKGTQWFTRIELFAVQAISLGTCRRPIEFLTSLHPCRRLSKIPNFQIHKVEKWKILSHFWRKDFFINSHEHKDRFFVVICPKKPLGHIKYWSRIDLKKVGHFLNYFPLILLYFIFGIMIFLRKTYWFWVDVLYVGLGCIIIWDTVYTVSWTLSSREIHTSSAEESS